MITVDYGNNKTRWGEDLTFRRDVNDIRTLTIDYTGELGSDTISTASASTTNITAATPAISSNIVTTSLSGGSEGTTAKVDMTITTTAGDKLSNTVYLMTEDY